MGSFLLRWPLVVLATHPFFFCAILFSQFLVPGAMAVVVQSMPLGFFFDWNNSSEPLPIPITTQCDTIKIKWARGAATGPNPTAPYSLHVYASTYEVPFIIDAGNSLNFDWAVPFAPGTQYQVCMFDKFGTTGGCQAMYTVVQNFTNPAPTCQNVTLPEALEVVGTVENGPMSRFGFINQCSDVSLLPTGGTPPYTMTVAPALHPPYQLKAGSMTAINWTVSLTWASPFFLSMTDSTGKRWAQGPMHAGGPGTDDCFTTAARQLSSSVTSTGASVAVGAGMGGLVGGLVVGALAAFFFLRFRSRRKALERIESMEKPQPFYGSRPQSIDHHKFPVDFDSPAIDSQPQSQVLSHSVSMNFGERLVRPSPLPFKRSKTVEPPTRLVIPNNPTQRARADTNASTATTDSMGDTARLYMLHRDAGHYSTTIEELPPRYIGSSGGRNPSRDSIDTGATLPSTTVSVGVLKAGLPSSAGGRSKF